MLRTGTTLKSALTLTNTTFRYVFMRKSAPLNSNPPHGGTRHSLEVTYVYRYFPFLWNLLLIEYTFFKLSTWFSLLNQNCERFLQGETHSYAHEKFSAGELQRSLCHVFGTKAFVQDPFMRGKCHFQ